MADRFNINTTRLEELKAKLANARRGNGRMSARQHTEMLNLMSASSAFEQELTLQQVLKQIQYIEQLKSTESATSADLMRLEVLKYKILAYD